MHSDSEVDQMIAKERRTKLRLSKCVRRYHLADQIITDKDARPMTRRRSRSDTCLVSVHEPKTMKETLDNEPWI